jgi:hypothetical protein
MTARELARRAFWSEHHPLSQMMGIAQGRWVNGEWRPAEQWSLRELIKFAESLPATIVDRLEGTPCSPSK